MPQVLLLRKRQRQGLRKSFATERKTRQIFLGGRKELGGGEISSECEKQKKKKREKGRRVPTRFSPCRAVVCLVMGRRQEGRRPKKIWRRNIWSRAWRERSFSGGWDWQTLAPAPGLRRCRGPLHPGRQGTYRYLARPPVLPSAPSRPQRPQRPQHPSPEPRHKGQRRPNHCAIHGCQTAEFTPSPPQRALSPVTPSL